MKTINEPQGSPGWHKARLAHFTASEAPAMLGKSKYQTRNELLKLKKTGVAPEVDDSTQYLFDKGHRAEAAIRPHVEEIIGEELYPVVGVLEDSKLLASFDGLTMLSDLAFEHKLFNQELAEKVRLINDGADIELDEHYIWQMEQQLLVSGAERVIFVVSDGTPEKMAYCMYEPVAGRREQLIDGWKQFEKDLASFEVKEVAPKVQAEYIPSLPALRVQINGSVTESNLSMYKEKVSAFISSVNTSPKTEQDFANAENTIKFCKNKEDELAQVKRLALAQTISFEELFNTIDDLSGDFRSLRLKLDKEVKSQKDFIRLTIMTDAKERLQNLWEELVIDCSKRIIPEDCPIAIDIMGAMKGKKTLDSLQNAADSELARASIEAEKLAERFETNLQLFDAEAHHCQSLFRDLNELIYKEPNDFKAVVLLRIAEYEAEQERRRQAEEERIRNEERAKLKAEQTKQEVVAAPVQEQPKQEVVAAPVQEQPKPAVKKQSPLMLEIGSWAKAKGLSKHDLEELKAILLNHGYEIAA